MHPLLTCTAACTALVVAAAPARAQCDEWTPGFCRPALPLGGVADAIAGFDSGSGRELYDARLPGGNTVDVLRWSGTSWDVSFSTVLTTTPRPALRSISLGGQPLFFLIVRNSIAGLPSDLWVFDGAAWSPFAAPFFDVISVAALDDGTGPALYAVGGVPNSPPFGLAGYVARWDGANWNLVGPPLASYVLDVAAFDDGAGVKLYAAGGATPYIVSNSSVASFDGVSWTAVGPAVDATFALREFGGALFGVGSRSSTPSGLRKLVGGAWTAIGSVPPTNAIDVANFGAGPRLVLACSQPSGAYSSDGNTAAPLAGGVGATPSGSVAVQLAVVDAGATQRVHFAGGFTFAGGFSCRGFASTDGSTWDTLGRGFDGAVKVLGALPAPGGDQVFAAGSFRYGGHAPALEGAARRQGGEWRVINTLNGSSRAFFAFRVLDLGSGPALYAGGADLLSDTTLGVIRWTGTTWTALSANHVGGDVHSLAAFDSGAGPELVVGGNFNGGPSGERISRFTGGNWTPLGSGMNNIVAALETYDDGTGTQLFAGGAFTLAGGVTTGGVARWDGSTWSALGAGITGGVNALCVFQGELWIAGTFTNAGGVPRPFLARWNGTAWNDVPNGAPNGGIFALCVHDDGRGPALYAGGGFNTIGGVTAYNLARFDGASWEPVDGGLDGGVLALTSCDDDADGDADLFVGGLFENTATFASGGIARLAGCPHYASICASDGTFADHVTPCPCGNDGLAAGHGCANSFNADGALLTASGIPNPDSIVLAGSGMPVSAFGLYMQHSAPDDRVFHDGVVCAGGTLTRIRGRASVGGASHFPDTSFANDATLTLSQRGQVTPGSGVTRYYSLFYRNVASTFCPPATANVTNGLKVIW